MKYSSDDLVTLSSGAAYRQKIGMYLSADRQEAINLGLRELVVNAQDEFEVYKPKNATLKIKLNTKTRKIQVTDNLRGIPVGIREDGINSLTAAFLLPHSGAKHREGAYFSSVGVNGQGNKIVCHTAKWLKVEVKREGNIYFQEFKSDEEGAKPLADVKIIGKTKDTGTFIEYEPDVEVYGDIFIDVDSLRKTLKEMSYFTRGLNIILDVDGKEEKFFSPNGLIDGLNNDTAFTKPLSYFYEDDECQVELALQWVTNNGKIKGYANGLYMPDEGAFMTGFKTSLTRFFNQKADTKLKGDAIRNFLDGFVSVKVRVGQFTNQQKTALANKEAQTATSRATTECLEEFYATRYSDFQKILAILEKSEKAEAAAERAREAIMSANKNIKEMSKKKVFAADKLKDARNLGENSILLLVEGDSALGPILEARDASVYGALTLGGKIINAYGHPEEKVLNSEKIQLIFGALGITPGAKKLGKLRYGRAAICTDADSDGAHIALLVMALMQRYCPNFLEEGRLFWLRAPLYSIKKGKKYHYYYNDDEFNKSTIKGEVSRYKGLGSLDNVSVVKESMFGANQRMEKLTWSKEAENLILKFMGEDIEPRKEFVYSKIDFGQEYE